MDKYAEMSKQYPFGSFWNGKYGFRSQKFSTFTALCTNTGVKLTLFSFIKTKLSKTRKILLLIV